MSAAAVVFDGDDTLWETERLYDESRSLARRVVEDAGVDGVQWEALARKRDLINFDLYGFSARRFPLSCVEAYDMLTGGRARSDVRQAIEGAARSVFSAPAPLAEGAGSVLLALRDDWKLILCTKGDAGVQRSRISSSGLEQYFDHVVIVEDKSPRTFQDAATHVGSAADESWSVGNSLVSDIKPAIAAGLAAIWIPTHVWEVEQAGTIQALPPPGCIANSLSEVPNIIRTADRG